MKVLFSKIYKVSAAIVDTLRRIAVLSALYLSFYKKALCTAATLAVFCNDDLLSPRNIVIILLTSNGRMKNAI